MQCTLFDPNSPDLLSGGDELVESWKEAPASVIWVNIVGPIPEAEQAILREGFGLHPLALQDANRDRHPPKIEEFEDHTFLLFKTLSRDTKDTDFVTDQFALFVGERFLVTRSSRSNRGVERLETEIRKDSQRFKEGSDSLAARLMRLFVDRYLQIILKLEPHLEKVEEGLLERTDDRVLAEVVGHKTDLKKLRRIFVYHEQILGAMRQRPHAGFQPERKHELTDVYEQQERASSLTLLYYELASDLIDGYLSLSSHRLNQIMKVLTIITAIFVPLSFLAGIYGMNFENMPELGTRSGYFILLGIMVTIATVALVTFHRRKWL